MPPKRTVESFGETVPLEAPTFYPSAVEFENPLRYIQSIREQSEQYGICCIVPPSNWQPPFVLDRNKLKFPTRVQKTNELLVRRVQRLQFMKELAEFWDAAGSPMSRIPVVCGKDVDLHLLHLSVKKLGGFETVTNDRKWTSVCEGMNIRHESRQHAAGALRKHYQQLILPFIERQCKRETPRTAAATAATQSGGETTELGRGVAADAAVSIKAESTTASVACAVEAAVPASSACAGSTDETAARAGGLLSRRAKHEVVRVAAGVTSNADEETVIAYEPPMPGEELCEECGSGEDNASMLLCDRCNCGFHLYCLTPKLSSVPAGDWFCAHCLKESFGFGSTRVFKFHQFERQANAFKHAFFETLYETGAAKLSKKCRAAGLASDAETRAMSRVRLDDFDVPADEVEWQFWNIVKTPNVPMEVLYGSDLDTERYGSGFPRAAGALPAKAAAAPASKSAHSAVAGAANGHASAQHKAQASQERKAVKYVNHRWNLNNFCRLDQCVLSHAGDNISGMMVPWLYVGMLFSSFCWHVEDHFAHSINYMHWGSPKTWYGVRGAQAEAFEAAVRRAVPELIESDEGLLFKMITMVPPSELRRADVDVCRLLQRPGSFVITWPRAYHAGFSHGLNCAESSNFATPDWLPWGRASVEAFRAAPNTRRPCFSHEMLLLTLARKASALSPHIAVWVAPELRALIETESEQHARLRAMGVAPDSANEDRWEDGEGLGKDAEAIADAAMDCAVAPTAQEPATAAESCLHAGDGTDATSAGSESIARDVVAASAPLLDSTLPLSAAPGNGVRDAAALASFNDAADDADSDDAQRDATPSPVCSVCDYECFLSAVAVRTSGERGVDDAMRAPAHLSNGGANGTSARSLTQTQIHAAPNSPACVYLCLYHALEGASAVGRAHDASACSLRIFRGGAALRRALARVERRASVANEWTRQTKLVLEPSGDARHRASLPHAQSLLQRGEQLQMDDECMLKLKQICRAASDISTKLQSVFAATARAARGRPLPTLRDCERVVGEAAAVPLDLPNLEELRQMLQRGLEWEQEAERVLSRGCACADVLKPLLERGARVPLSLPHFETARAMLAAIEWEEEANAVIAAIEVARHGAEAIAATAGAALLTDVDRTDCDADDDASRVAMRAVDATDPMDAEIASAEAAAPAAPPLPPFERARTLVTQGQALALADGAAAALLRLQEAVRVAQSWAADAADALKRGCSFERMQRLCASAADLELHVDVREALCMKTTAAAAWLERARPMLERGGGCRLAAQALIKASKQLGKVSDVAVAAKKLADAERAARSWIMDAEALFIKLGCSRPLAEVIGAADGLSAEWPPSEAEMEHSCPCCTGEALSAQHGELNWVGCDKCDAWFHAHCVGVDDAETIDTFCCPRCCLATGAAWAFGPRLPALRRTRRPAMHEVAALLSEAEALTLRVDEAQLVARAMVETEVWVRRLDDAQRQGDERLMSSLLDEADRLVVLPHRIEQPGVYVWPAE